MNRRQFIQRALCATAGSALFTQFAGKMALAHAAAVANGGKRLLGSGYQALVCVNLYGGNDAFNMLVPRFGTPRAGYDASRGALALPAGSLLPLAPVTAPSDGGSYGLHPSMPQLAALFNQASSPLAFAANVGPLLYPTTKQAYQDESVPVPYQLFSHADQTTTWQLPAADYGSRRGWGGLLADMFHASNSNQQLSMNISIDGENVFQAGNQVVPYFVGPDGAREIAFISEDESWDAARRATFLALRDASHAHAMQREYARIMTRSMQNGQMLSLALAGAPPLTTVFPDTPLGAQLGMVARLIHVRAALGMQRQIFFVGRGSFDTHDSQLTDQAEKLAEVDGALAAFHAATAEMGVADDVTSFTASEFGRTTSINGDGTDHGWGSHHMILGGGVNGGRLYGTLPDLAPDSADDADWGQIIPTTSVDQYAATLARWYGVPASDIPVVFPNIGRFATADLGFMA